MKLPNVVATGGIAILLFALNWTLSNIGQFSIPGEYLTIVTGLLGVAIAAVAKLVQESAVLPNETTARGLDPAPEQRSLAARVLWG
jgi:hypothetical protein